MEVYSLPCLKKKKKKKKKNGVYLESQYCCGGLFADDTVLVAPSKQALKKILNKVHVWAIKDEMTFGINKCATLVVKSINFVKPINYEGPSSLLVVTNYLNISTLLILVFLLMNLYHWNLIQSKLNSNLKCQVKFVLSISLLINLFFSHWKNMF